MANACGSRRRARFCNDGAWQRALNLPQWMSLACEKCGCERDVQLPREDGTFMTAERYMALHKVAGMVLLCATVRPSAPADSASELLAIGYPRVSTGWQSLTDGPTS